MYRQTSNISCTFVGNTLADHSNAVGVFHRRCSQYIFILDLTHGFNTLGKANCKTRRETSRLWNSVRLILDVSGYIKKHIRRRFTERFVGLIISSIPWKCVEFGALKEANLNLVRQLKIMTFLCVFKQHNTGSNRVNCEINVGNLTNQSLVKPPQDRRYTLPLA